MNTDTPHTETPHTEPETPNRFRRNTAIGLATGLLGGGAVGLLLTVPSLTSAADDTASEPAAVVALHDDATGPFGDGPEGERPEPGTRLRELLQQLVDDGTLRADQADAVTEFLIENRPEPGDRPGHHRPGHHRGPGFDGDVVAGLLGIDVDQLRSEMRAGASIAEIAEARGVDVQTVIDALVDEAMTHLALAVDNGRLTEDEAADMAARITERITARVDGERPPGH
ncbi:MAG TPA: hypothetical protein VIS05_07225 [Ilumatobacter sp.]